MNCTVASKASASHLCWALSTITKSFRLQSLA
jgi:hypothetical protein